MPLNFPSNPTVGQNYSSGSTATYQWDGAKWVVVQPTSTTVVSAISARTSSFVNPLNQPVIVSGSFTVFTGSGVEFGVTDTGVKLGNLITDRHNLTGSLNVSGSITASLFGTASVLPIPATSIMAVNTSALTFSTASSTDITGWTNVVAENASQWNASTGVFTAARTGSYIVACSVQFGQMNMVNLGSELSVFTSTTGQGSGAARFFNQVANVNTFPPSIHFTCLVRFTAANQTMKIQVYNGNTTNATNHTNGTTLMIQEVSSTISR